MKDEEEGEKKKDPIKLFFAECFACGQTKSSPSFREVVGFADAHKLLHVPSHRIGVA